MPEETTPKGGRSVRPVDLEAARLWLAGRGLADVRPTPLLAARLAVRRRARLAAAVLLAVFLIGVALVYVGDLPTDASGGVFGPRRRWLLLVLTAMVFGMVLGLSLLDRWVRRVDRLAAAALPRRAAHPVRLGWRAVLGVPRAAFLVTTYAAAATLAIGALTARDSTARYGPVILLVGLCGVATGTIVQLRHVLRYPVVADDEGSLTADFLMRVEDAREVAVPTVVWSLPVMSVFGSGLDSWNTAWLVFIFLSVVALALITAWTGRSTLVTQQATSAR